MKYLDMEGLAYFWEKIKNTNIAKNIIAIGLSSNVTKTISSAWVGATVDMNTLKYRIGNKLTFENGKIKVGAGVSNLMISGNCMVKGIVGDIFVQLKKNDTIISQGYYRPTVNSYFGTIGLTQQPIEVAEGDVISLVVGSSVAGTLTVAGTNYTWITAEVIS